MPRNRLLRDIAVLVCIIAALQFTAISFHLYWTFWWYDIILHFLGGIFVGLLILWFRFFSGYFGVHQHTSEVSTFFFIVIATLIVGVGWEAFERALGQTWSVEGYYVDTILDVIFDLIGSVVAFYFFRSRYMTHEKNV